MKNLLKVLLLLVCLSAPLLAQKNEAPTIYVMITDNSGVKLYSENLPLLNIMQLRDVYTNNNPGFTFTFEIPKGWGILFENESISFASTGCGSVPLNWVANAYYGFTITTQPDYYR